MKMKPKYKWEEEEKGNGENFQRNVSKVSLLNFPGVDALPCFNKERGDPKGTWSIFSGMPQVEHRCHFPKYSPAFFRGWNLGSGCDAPPSRFPVGL